MNTFLIIDFDSTFITGESLEWLAEEALFEYDFDERERILHKIDAITCQGMNGEISFEDSIQKRLDMFQPNKQHIYALIHRIRRSITPSFERNLEFIRNNAENIRFISGGFVEYMRPVLTEFGIAPKNIIGNSFVFDSDKVIGFEEENVLSKQGGKREAVRSLHLDGNIFVIGDGYTDFEVVAGGVGDVFIALTENIRRDFIDKYHPLESKSFEGALSHLSFPHKE